eukprot:6194813-Pleurochrysis_carterae.AAC.1
MKLACDDPWRLNDPISTSICRPFDACLRLLCEPSGACVTADTPKLFGAKSGCHQPFRTTNGCAIKVRRMNHCYKRVDA